MDCPALPLQRLVARRMNLSPKSARRHLPAVPAQRPGPGPLLAIPGCASPSSTDSPDLAVSRKPSRRCSATGNFKTLFHLPPGARETLPQTPADTASTDSPAGTEEGPAAGPCNRWNAPPHWLDSRDRDHSRMGGNRTKSCCLETRLSRCK